MSAEVGSIERLTRYPVSGVAGIDSTVCELQAGGLRLSRAWVAYDISDKSEYGFARVSSKRRGEAFADLEVSVGPDGPHETFLLSTRVTGKEMVLDTEVGPHSVYVDEFGDPTYCWDAGDSAAKFMREALDDDDVRLAVKHPEWRRGAKGPSPMYRKVAPLHIVTRSSVEALRADIDDPNYSTARFRPEVVIAGDLEPGVEQSWVGRTLAVGGVIVDILRPTERCVVTGYDTETGSNHKDVLKALKSQQEEADESGPLVFGVYAVARTREGLYKDLTVNDPVVLIDA